jgi:hypothetical protein
MEEKFNLNVVELFSGSGTFSKEFERNGHKVFSIDIRKRKGICEPHLRKDIMHVRLSDIPFKKVHVLWASPPCDVFSKASGSFHWTKEGKPKTEKCLVHIKLLKKTLKLIDKIHPGYFFIENPDSKMKYQKDLVNFLIRNNAMTKKVNYLSYGFGTLKPTTIFTNALNYNPKYNSNDPSSKNILHDTLLENYPDHDSFNRKDRVIFDNLTKSQKQTIPVKFAREIREFCEIERGPEK